LADVSSATVRISLTLPATPGDCVWLWNIVGETPTDWISGAGDHALCVWSTGGWVTGVRLLRALVVLADKAGTAVRISFTFSLAPCDCVRHGHEASEAATDWVAQMVGSALGVWATGRRITGIRLDHALVVPADVARAAVRVSDTLSVAASDGVRGGDVASLALADWIPIGVGAVGVWSTWAWITWVWPYNAFLIPTDKTLLAVRVSDTLRPTACDSIGFWDQTRFTAANWVASKVNCTHGSRPTWRWIARIRFFYTLLVLADVASLTIRVNDTFWFAARDCIRVGDESGLATTNGIA